MHYADFVHKLFNIFKYIHRPLYIYIHIYMYIYTEAYIYMYRCLCTHVHWFLIEVSVAVPIKCARFRGNINGLIVRTYPEFFRKQNYGHLMLVWLYFDTLQWTQEHIKTVYTRIHYNELGYITKILHMLKDYSMSQVPYSIIPLKRTGV